MDVCRVEGRASRVHEPHIPISDPITHRRVGLGFRGLMMAFLYTELIIKVWFGQVGDPDLFARFGTVVLTGSGSNRTEDV
jgi:hypothetical protein